MSAVIIDGKVWSARIKEQVRGEVAALAAQGIGCCLTVILVGEDPASVVYVRGKEKDCIECGIDSRVLRLPESVTQQELLDAVQRCNRDPSVNGVLVQLPLPGHLDEKAVLDAIDPAKDVDGFTPENAGRLLQGRDTFVPCTPAGCLYLLQQNGIPLEGRRAVVIGRSNLVGKPMAVLLTGQNATVTLCHSRTQGLADICREADILVAAVGRAGFVTADMVRPGAAVIDVGINRGADGRLCGDVDFAAVREKAGWITPVPGGVGLMTRAMLLVNTVRAAKRQHGIY